MNERTLATVRAAVDIAYTSLAIGLVLYTFRAEVRRAVAAKRTEIEAHASAVEAKAREIAARRGFYRSDAFRESLARQEANATENMNAALDAFANDCDCEAIDAR